MKFPPGDFDNDQINVLQVAHSVACKELCINKADQESRERVAAMMIAFAKYGHIESRKTEGLRGPTILKFGGVPRHHWRACV